MRTQRNQLQNSQMGIFFVLATEVMMFLALVSAYIVIRANVPDWPPIGQPRLPAEATAINTVALLISGVLYHLLIKKVGVFDYEDKEQFKTFLPVIKKYLWWAFGLGFFFVAFQGYEWIQLIGYGLTMSSGIYAGFFYTIIGCHAIHTVVGLILLLVVLVRPSYVKLQTIKWYWYFVVGLWPLLYISVYLV